ncbi:FkbM family methyltransferase [Rhodobacter capsulatus]|uniref:FkbM family methyltransferase n=1 Tax=Rhodobacter capsulatus TaxID=1061 RepID=UPI004029A4FD
MTTARDFTAAPGRAGPLAVIACQRNEAMWLLEWVAFQHAAGFDRVFVVSNDCSDGSDRMLDRLAEMGEVVHLRQDAQPDEAPQVTGCALALAHPQMADVAWAFHCDIDEFLNVSCGEGRVADLIAAVLRAGPTDCITVNWRMFGSGGRRSWDGGAVLPSFTLTEAQLRKGRAMQKCLFRPEVFAAVHCHMPKHPRKADPVLRSSAGVEMPNAPLFAPQQMRHQTATHAMVSWENAALNHYAIRSQDVFLLKNLRGDGMALTHQKYRLGSPFWAFAERTEIEDRTILRHWPAVAARLERYRADPEIRALEAEALAGHARLRAEILDRQGRFGWHDPAPKQPLQEVPKAHLPDTAGAVRFLLSQLPRERRTVVLDVGANPITPTPYKTLLGLQSCEVIGFEPQPEAFAALQSARSPRERYFPHAVGDGTAQQLKIFRFSGMTSVFEPCLPSIALLGKPRMGRVIERVALPTVALDTLPEIGRIDLLKIDIQGGELAVFQGARQTLAQAVAVIVELRHLRLYEGEPMAAGVDQELRAQGFALHKFLFNKSMPIANSQLARLSREANSDQLVDGDAVYLRDLTRLDAIDDEGLVQLAILAASTFDSHTVALACLDALAARGRIPASLARDYVDALPARLRSDPA